MISRKSSLLLLPGMSSSSNLRVTSLIYQLSFFVIILLCHLCLVICFPQGYCPDIFRPVNGHMKGNCKGAMIGDVCSFYCVEGYKVRGESSITCRSTGSWDYSTPTCEGPVKCRDIWAPSSGSTSGFCSPGYAGLVCSFQCRPGFTLEGPSGIVCLPDGYWNKSPPYCVDTRKAMCPPLSYGHANGGVFMGTCSPGKQGSTCTLKCAEGFILEGFETYECGPDGKWWPYPVASNCRFNNTAT